MTDATPPPATIRPVTGDEYRRLRNMLAAISVMLLITVGLIWWDGRAADDRAIRQTLAAEHARCVAANNARQEIKDAFEALYDGFITATAGSQSALDFKAEGMANLERGLPQRDCDAEQENR